MQLDHGQFPNFPLVVFERKRTRPISCQAAQSVELGIAPATLVDHANEEAGAALRRPGHKIVFLGLPIAAMGNEDSGISLEGQFEDLAPIVAGGVPREPAVIPFVAPTAPDELVCLRSPLQLYGELEKVAGEPRENRFDLLNEGLGGDGSGHRWINKDDAIAFDGDTGIVLFKFLSQGL